jgi:hypothetical protein
LLVPAFCSGPAKSRVNYPRLVLSIEPADSIRSKSAAALVSSKTMAVIIGDEARSARSWSPKRRGAASVRYAGATTSTREKPRFLRSAHRLRPELAGDASGTHSPRAVWFATRGWPEL